MPEAIPQMVVAEGFTVPLCHSDGDTTESTVHWPQRKKNQRNNTMYVYREIGFDCSDGYSVGYHMMKWKTD